MNDSQRILHLISRLDGYGGARMLRYLAASQAAFGHQVTVGALWADAEPARELREQGAKVTTLSSRWRFDPLSLGRLARLRRRLGADVTHCWDARMLLQGLLTPGSAHQGAIVTSLDAAQACQRWLPRLLRAGRWRVDAWAVADSASESWLRKHVLCARIELIQPGAVAPTNASRTRDQLRAHLGVSSNEIAICVAGPLVRQRQFDEAIWFFELVRVLHESARLLVFGDGPDRARLEQFAEEVSDPGCIRFFGYRSDFQQLLPAADMYWRLDPSPSTPLAMLEAQAAGVPVIASDVPSHRAAIQDEETGLLVPVGARAELARAADRLVTDQALRGRLATAAKAHVTANWSLGEAIESYQELYKRIVDKADA